MVWRWQLRWSGGLSKIVVADPWVCCAQPIWRKWFDENEPESCRVPDTQRECMICTGIEASMMPPFL